MFSIYYQWFYVCSVYFAKSGFLSQADSHGQRADCYETKATGIHSPADVSSYLTSKPEHRYRVLHLSLLNDDQTNSYARQYTANISLWVS